MQSDRIQQRINTFLDEADEAAARSDWARVRDRAQNVLAFDPENSEALSYIAAADRADPSQPANHPEQAAIGSRTDGAPVGNGRRRTRNPQSEIRGPQSAAPASFCDGRYRVVRFLGEGGKKRVYLCHDAKLDR